MTVRRKERPVNRIALLADGLCFIVTMTVMRPFERFSPRLARGLDRWGGRLLAKLKASDRSPVSEPQPRLMSLDRYPDDLDEAGRDRVDERLRRQLHMIPTEPGVYYDNQGEPWVLDEDGGWTDHLGERRTSPDTAILSAFGPWTSEALPRG